MILVCEVAFFIYCFQWLASGKKLREKQFEVIDSERKELQSLQQKVSSELQRAQILAGDTLEKLTLLGSQVNAEWNEMSLKTKETTAEVVEHVKQLIDSQLSQLTESRLSVEKTLSTAQHRSQQLGDVLKKCQGLLKFFDKSVPADEIVKQLQSDKYSEARQMLLNGQSASLVSKKLGISLSEVSLLASMG